MKKNFWYVYLFETEEKKDIVNTISEMSYVLKLESNVLSNFFHSLIKPRGILKYCNIYQSIPL